MILRLDYRFVSLKTESADFLKSKAMGLRIYMDELLIRLMEDCPSTVPNGKEKTLNLGLFQINMGPRSPDRLGRQPCKLTVAGSNPAGGFTSYGYLSTCSGSSRY